MTEEIFGYTIPSKFEYYNGAATMHTKHRIQRVGQIGELLSADLRTKSG
jgi:hypothetical protein